MAIFFELYASISFSRRACIQILDGATKGARFLNSIFLSPPALEPVSIVVSTFACACGGSLEPDACVCVGGGGGGGLEPDAFDCASAFACGSGFLGTSFDDDDADCDCGCDVNTSIGNYLCTSL